MTEEQVKLVKQSWRYFRNVDPVIVADLFYTKLFTDHPALRKMFPKDMKEQYVKLIDMISIIVSRLDQLDLLTDEIAAMARRHVEYGTRPAHYKMVGKALLWTLEKGHGNEWNQKLAEAWTTCYGLLAETMIHAAETPAAGNDNLKK